MSSRPGALPFFSIVMPMSSSSAVNALMNPGSSGYRCRSKRTFGCLFGALPLSRSWCIDDMLRKRNCRNFETMASGDEPVFQDKVPSSDHGYTTMTWNEISNATARR